MADALPEGGLGLEPEAPPEQAGSARAPSTARLPYCAPRLKALGSVRDLTLGQSGGRRIDVGSKNRYS